MEKMPYQPAGAIAPAVVARQNTATTSNWQKALPVLQGRGVTLRQLRQSDAASLHALLTTEEVSRFISPPPTTVEGFERFIAWTHAQCLAGAYVCFAVTLTGQDAAVGIFQVRALGSSFDTAEWGFALGSPYWGTGLFREGAELVLEFAFETLGVHRLEARASVRNGRGNGALRKIGAVQEGVLRSSFARHGEYHDQAIYSILVDDWRSTSERIARPIIH
jgi:ribosomal-protein-alanine N-acetyltransferase